MKQRLLQSGRGAACYVALAALCFVAAPVASHAQGVNMSGQRVQATVSTTTGGALDIYTRLVAAHIGAFLPGNPTVVTVNMPGAGGMIEINWLYNAAPKDGSVFGIVPMSGIFASLLGDSQARYDPRKFSWIGSLARYDGAAVVWHDSPFKTAQDMLDHDIVIGGGGAGSDMFIWPNLLRTLIGAKIKLVNGYVGTSGIALAMERGEVQGMIGPEWDGLVLSKPDWLRDKKVRLLMQIALDRRSDLRDVPTVLEFAKTPEDRSVLELFIMREIYSDAFTAPPGIPAAVLAAYRQAFAQMAKDPAFLADAAKVGAEIEPASGEDLEALAQRIYAYPPEIIARAKKEYAKAKGS